jgi:hypothetical protein
MLLFSAQDPVWAQGKKSGHDTTNTSTQGNSGKTNTNANPDNEGQTTTTTTGPKGQLDKGNTGCNNCDSTVTDRPGKNK